MEQKRITIDGEFMENIRSVAARMLELAKQGYIVDTVFNETPLTTENMNSVDDILKQRDYYQTRKYEEYRNSPQYEIDKEVARQKELEEKAKLDEILRKQNEYATTILENLPEILSTYPVINTDNRDIDLAVFENLKPGAYRINETPSADLLEKLPFYENSEIGILCIQDQWLLLLGEKGIERIGMPKELQAIENYNLFQIAMHSHPFDPNDEYKSVSYYPSFTDLFAGRTTEDGAHYIISSHGITRFAIKNIKDYILLDNSPKRSETGILEMVVMKNNHPVLNPKIEYDDLMIRFQSFASSWAEEYGKRYSESKSEAYIPFVEKYFDVTLIPFENMIAIEEILSHGNIRKK